MRRAIIAVVSFLLVAIVATGCQPVPDRIAIAGDSVTVQAAVYGSQFVGNADTKDMVGLGWKASTATNGITNAVNNIKRSPEYLVLAFGMNDRDGNVWDESERQAMMTDVFAADPTAGVVLVLPWSLDGKYPDAISDIRNGLVQLAASRNAAGSRTAVVDWKPVVEADPTLLGPDGVHLNTSTPEAAQRAAEAYGNLMESGVSALRGNVVAATYRKYTAR